MKIQSNLVGDYKQFIRERIKLNELNGIYMSFTFTIDAFPGYTRFDQSKKVLAAIDIMDAVHGLDTSRNYRTKTNDVKDTE